MPSRCPGCAQREMARVRTLSDLGRRQPWSGWEQRLLGAEPVCEPRAKFEGPTSGRKWGGFVSLLYVPGCGRPPLSVSSAVCPAAPGALRGGSPVSRSRIRPPNLSLSLWPSGAPPPECCLHPSVSVQWVGHPRPRHLPDSHGRSCGVHTKCSGFCIRTF